MLLHSNSIFLPNSYHSFIISQFIKIPFHNSNKHILFIKPSTFNYLNYKNCNNLLNNLYHKDLPIYFYNDISILYQNKFYLSNKDIYFSFHPNKHIYWNVIQDPIQYQLGY